MFHKSAAYYDLIYRGLKDYGEEAAKLDHLLKLLEPRPLRLLDLGCGTGEHARQLRQRFGYQVDGIDIEPAFIDIAAAKNPGADFTVADMRSFRLPRRYDALLCLFSSIGYVETLDGLANAFASMARHLAPGGWLLCEPWQSPADWVPGQIDAVEVTDPATGATITRTRLGSTEGKVSVLKIDYDILSPTGAEEHFEEVHRLGLFTEDEMTEALATAGFTARWSTASPLSRPLLLATFLP